MKNMTTRVVVFTSWNSTSEYSIIALHWHVFRSWFSLCFVRLQVEAISLVLGSLWFACVSLENHKLQLKTTSLYSRSDTISSFQCLEDRIQRKMRKIMNTRDQDSELCVYFLYYYCCGFFQLCCVITRTKTKPLYIDKFSFLLKLATIVTWYLHMLQRSKELHPQRFELKVEYSLRS